MLKVQNTTQQPLLVHRGMTSSLHLLVGGRAVLSEEEAELPQIRALIAMGLLDARPIAKQPSKAEVLERDDSSAGRHDQTGEVSPNKAED